MAGTGGSPLNLTLPNILLGVVCIVVANLLPAALRMAGDIPLSDTPEQAIAVAISVLAWFFIAAKLQR